MGLFDQFTNLSPEQNQGLLAAAAALLQAGGPSRTPTSFGQALGGGLQAYQQSTDAARKRKIDEDQAAQIAKLTSLKIRDAESDFTNQEAQRKRAEDLRQFYIKQATGEAPDAIQTPAAMGSNLAPTVENAALLQSLTPPQPQGGQKASIFDQRMALAQKLRNAGFSQEADAQETSALKFQPKVKEWQKVNQGGKVLYAPYFEDGTSGQPVPLEVAEKLQFQNTGAQTLGLNPFTGVRVASFNNTQSPDSAANVAATIRGQDLVDQRARDANEIARSGKVVTASTGLRKEFEDLPEVKSYKQALPAFNAIVDATKRNTTQSDINIVYGLAKLYDPNSVVREGEYATVANSPNIPERIKGYAQYISGGGKLSPNTKKEILAEANGRIGSYEDQYAQARTNFEDIAKRSGGDPSLLFPTEFKPAKTQAENKTISLADIAETARKSGRTTAEVTAAARAKGYTIGGR